MVEKSDDKERILNLRCEDPELLCALLARLRGERISPRERTILFKFMRDAEKFLGERGWFPTRPAKPEVLYD